MVMAIYIQYLCSGKGWHEEVFLLYCLKKFNRLTVYNSCLSFPFAMCFVSRTIAHTEPKAVFLSFRSR